MAIYPVYLARLEPNSCTTPSVFFVFVACGWEDTILRLTFCCLAQLGFQKTRCRGSPLHASDSNVASHAFRFVSFRLGGACWDVSKVERVGTCTRRPVTSHVKGAYGEARGGSAGY